MLEFLDVQVNLALVVGLYLAFRAKQFLCDYPLQTTWMALGKGKATGWFAPLAVHAGIHGAATALICAVVNPAFIWLGVLDMALHFAIDRIKACPSIGGRFTPNQPYFWWALGADQEAHNLTHFAYIVVLLLAATGAS
jgi:hypothetical protein